MNTITKSRLRIIVSAVVSAVAVLVMFTYISPTTNIAQAAEVTSASIHDGDVVRVTGTQDVYLIKITGVHKFRRLVLNPDIFNSYGQLSWGDVKDVSQVTLDKYTNSNLVIHVNAQGNVVDPKVYSVTSSTNSDTGAKRWLNIASTDFDLVGLMWDSIYTINDKEAADTFYPTAAPLTSSDDVATWATNVNAGAGFPVSVSAPTVMASGATEITSTSATLNGNVDTGGLVTTAWVRYSATNPGTCNDTFGDRGPATGGYITGTGATYPFSFQAPWSTTNTLTPSTTYYYCAIASNSLGTSFSNMLSFATVATGADTPLVTTLDASSVTSTSAALNGSIDAYGGSVDSTGLHGGWFRYGTTNPGTCNSTFGTRAPAVGAFAGNTTPGHPASQPVTGLTPSTTYYFCIIDRNTVGTTYGNVVSFTTLAAGSTGTAPTVTTSAATGIGASYATLNGSVNPNGLATRAGFRYSITNPGTCNNTFGTYIWTVSVEDGETMAFGFGSPQISGLTPNASYYYCAIASNSAGTGYGNVLSFTTLAAGSTGIVITASPASSVTSTSAKLNGSSSNYNLYEYTWFRYSATNPGTCNDNFGTRAPAGTAFFAMTNPGTFQYDISGLTPNTTYYYCVVAAIGQSTSGTHFSSMQSFTTTDTAPTVTTLAATDLISTAATLNGSVNSNGVSGNSAWFRYSTTNPVTCSVDSFGLSSDLTPVGSGTVTVSTHVAGLSANTTYYFCAMAASAVSTGGGKGYGSVLSFTTPPVTAGIVPTITTSAATNLTSTGATLNGSVNPNGLSTTAWFRYYGDNPGSCNDTSGIRISLSNPSIGSGNASVQISSTFSDFPVNSTHYYCAIASNSAGIGYGNVLPFTTLAAAGTAPTVTTSAATDMTTTSATLNGTANPKGLSTNAWFRYSTANPGTCNDTFGTSAPVYGGLSLGSGGSDVNFSIPLSGLTLNTLYYYCAIAINNAGESFGAMHSFATTPNSTLTVSVSGATPVARQVLSGSSDVEFSRIKFTATVETINVTKLVFTRASGSASPDNLLGGSDTDFASVYLQNLSDPTWGPNRNGKSNPIQLVGGKATFNFSSADGILVVQNNSAGYEVALKGNLNTTSTGVTSGDAPKFYISSLDTNNITASGFTTGTQLSSFVTGSPNPTIATNFYPQTIYQGVLNVSVDSTSLSGNQTRAANQTFFKFGLNTSSLNYSSQLETFRTSGADKIVVHLASNGGLPTTSGTVPVTLQQGSTVFATAYYVGTAYAGTVTFIPTTQLTVIQSGVTLSVVADTTKLITSPGKTLQSTMNLGSSDSTGTITPGDIFWYDGSFALSSGTIRWISGTVSSISSGTITYQ